MDEVSVEHVTGDGICHAKENRESPLPPSDSEHVPGSSSEVGSSDGVPSSPCPSESGQNPEHDDQPTTPGKDSDTPNEGVVSVRCGSLQARMHLHRFMCPGIHQPCIEFDGEFYTPKQFTVVAAKDKQKDWKGSIKYQRVPLRQLMERKQLDFYRHDTYCSGKCASKNYRAYREAITNTSASNAEEYIHNMQAAAVAAGLFRRPSTSDNYDSTPSFPDLTTQLAGQLAASVSAAAASAVKREAVSPLQQCTPDLANALARQFGILGGPLSNLAALHGAMGMPQVGVDGNESIGGTEESLMLKRPLIFWEGVLHLGLFDDLVNEVATTFQQYKATFAARPDLRPQIAGKLSEVVAALRIPEMLHKRLLTKRMINKAERDMLANEVLELRKRADEQNRRQLEAKRKSEIFDQLLASQQPPAKSPKLH